MNTELGQVWHRVLENLQHELIRPMFETWIKNARPLALYGDTMVVGVANSFTKDWVESKYSSLLTDTVRGVLGKNINIKFVVPPISDKQSPNGELALSSRSPATTSTDSLGRHFNPKYTFDTFVVGPSNRLAHAACLAVAEAPATAYNPLFLYGGVGLGKTHLMQAIGHYASGNSKKLKVSYVSSETFTNELITSIRDRTTADFRNKYRTVDILLIDDIQFLAGKEGTQEEFFHTFDALHHSCRQIVISSDRPPREIATLEERLRTRFEWGLICDIQPPDLETRIAILRKKAVSENLDLPMDVLIYIASKIETNIRELEGALIRVTAYSSLISQPVTIELTKEALKDIIPESKVRRITINLIQKIVAKHYNLDQEDLKLKRRTRAVAFPRQIAMYISRNLTDASLPRIGEEFGGRDHTTVIHACEKITREIENDAELDSTVKYLISQIKASV